MRGSSTCYDSEDNVFVGLARGHPGGASTGWLADRLRRLAGLRANDNGHKLGGAADQLLTNTSRSNRPCAYNKTMPGSRRGDGGKLPRMPRTYKAHAGELPYRRSRLRVVLADGHTILRRGLRAILDAETDLEVIGEASNVEDAVALVRRLQPDVLITDVSFENGSGIQAIGDLRREGAGVRVVLLTGHNSQENVRAAMTAGVHAYIVKDSPVEDLLRAIRSQSSEFDRPTIPVPPLRNRERSTVPPAAAPIPEMTVREREVLIGIALGYSSKLIAGQLGRSVKTIEKHRFKMMHKLGLRNAAAAARYAIDHGLLDAAGESQELPPAPGFPRN
jgi:DNA-binding NarL/FixJ family response regulator